MEKKFVRRWGVRWIVRTLLVVGFGIVAYEVAKPYLSNRVQLVAAQPVGTPSLDDLTRVRGFEVGQPLFIRIFKEASELEVWLRRSDGYALFKTYPICNYSGTLGPKLKEGDLQSPEGFYVVGRSQLNPNSRYHLSFNLGFPNRYDRAKGRTGSYLMVHGDCVSIGCYAMTDAGIDEIYRLADAALARGQETFQVHAFPFRLTPENLARYSKSPWLPFWMNLKGGYDHFEKTRDPPVVSIVQGAYEFRPQSN